MFEEIVVTGIVGEGVLFLAHPNGEVEELGAPETPSGIAAVSLCELSHYYGLPIPAAELTRLSALEREEIRKAKRRR